MHPCAPACCEQVRQGDMTLIDDLQVQGQPFSGPTSHIHCAVQRLPCRWAHGDAGGLAYTNMTRHPRAPMDSGRLVPTAAFAYVNMRHLAICTQLHVFLAVPYAVLHLHVWYVIVQGT